MPKYDNLELNKTERILFVEMKSKQLKCFIERIESDYSSLKEVTIIPAADIRIDNLLVQKLYADFKLLDYGIDFNISIC